ncbi:MAG TPA: glycosyl hydrolase [Pyrinomonadaceae bacterium]|nr:glycosyl hydrolase [Pyrinomonadaceae bacterium]
MKRLTVLVAIVLLAIGFAPPAQLQAQNIDELQRLFERPPDDARIMMRWWWFGPAVTKPELEREMRVMKEGGIGGFEVQPVYPLTLDDAEKGIRNFPFLSDEHIDALRFVSAKARELGLRMDLTIGSGWPYGGPQVSVDHASGMLRSERVKVDAKTRRVPVPNLGAGEKLIAAFLVRTRGQSIDLESIREITDISDGVARLSITSDEPQEVVFFISSRTGMQVKRPSIGSEGFVLDHLSRTATDNYLKAVGDRLMQAFGSQRPYAIFCDSLEVYNQDWTSDFLGEFKKRRGYDLKPYLPALIADVGPKTGAIRHDWGQTLTDLLNERFLIPLRDWSKLNKTRLRMQNYGIPAAVVSSNAYVDLPEGEGPQWKVLRASRWASSASHLYGRPVTSSETWTWLHSPVFRATPLDVKAEADLHFLEGINQLIGHGWPYTPPGVEYPGWRFYAAGVFDEKNPWWIVMPDLALYLQRVSFLLRQGQPANDVALYLPNSDAWAHSSAGHTHLIETLRELVGPDVIPRILESGYNFDFFDDAALATVGRVEKDGLVLGANKYRVVVLPAVERIPLNTLRKLEDFVRGGGVLIATRRLPSLAPGLQATLAEQNEVRAIVQRLFEGQTTTSRFVKDENELPGTLTTMARPDVAFSPAVPEIGFIHRRSGDAEIYFLANSSNVRRSVEATFRVTSLQPEWWDPLNGRVSAAEVSARPEGRTTIRLDLEPYGSRVIIFSRRNLAKPKPLSANVIAAEMDLSTDWKVSFGESSKPVIMDQLRSWTDDEETRYFSGVATYEKTIDVDQNLLREGLAVQLDFGEGIAIPEQPIKAGMQTWFDPPVREAAVVFVNGQRAGSVWCAPYAIDLTRLIRAGKNTLRIEVANLALNYMAGHRLPDYRLLSLRYGERFQAQDMDKIKPIPSGLTGKLRLISMKP